MDKNPFMSSCHVAQRASLQKEYSGIMPGTCKGFQTWRWARQLGRLQRCYPAALTLENEVLFTKSYVSGLLLPNCRTCDPISATSTLKSICNYANGRRQLDPRNHLYLLPRSCEKGHGNPRCGLKFPTIQTYVHHRHAAKGLATSICPRLPKTPSPPCFFDEKEKGCLIRSMCLACFSRKQVPPHSKSVPKTLWYTTMESPKRLGYNDIRWLKSARYTSIPQLRSLFVIDCSRPWRCRETEVVVL
jgi:hypothetical protein